MIVIHNKTDDSQYKIERLCDNIHNTQLNGWTTTSNGCHTQYRINGGSTQLQDCNTELNECNTPQNGCDKQLDDFSTQYKIG